MCFGLHFIILKNIENQIKSIIDTDLIAIYFNKCIKILVLSKLNFQKIKGIYIMTDLKTTI